MPGALRVYHGHGDQRPDPLIVAAEGSRAPAFVGTAYIVFEDLELADFGNRIPALTFEVYGQDGALGAAAILGDTTRFAPTIAAPAGFPALAGYSHEGGSLRDALATLNALYPMQCVDDGVGLSITDRTSADAVPVVLPEAAWRITDDAAQAGDTSVTQTRGPRDIAANRALRYYDSGRDYQPGLQRSGGRSLSTGSRTIEFPGTLTARDAVALVDAAAMRDRFARDTVRWPIVRIDPATRPGAVVTLPDRDGRWIVESWEWSDTGIMLDLARIGHGSAAEPPNDMRAGQRADTGTVALPPITQPTATVLRAFELPWDGTGNADARTIFVAASGATASWRGASLYRENGDTLQPIGTVGRTRSIMGALTMPIGSSRALQFEPAASLTIDLVADDLTLTPADIAMLARGANRALIGGEIVQFASATPTGSHRWQLTGLLRGRGGTERAAMRGHPAGTPFTLLDDTLESIDGGSFPIDPDLRLAAIGRYDDAPIYAPMENTSAGLRPLAPVHATGAVLPDGSANLRWIRRARGSWGWLPEVDAPLVELQRGIPHRFGRYRRAGCGVDQRAARPDHRCGTMERPARAISRCRIVGAASGRFRAVGPACHSPPPLISHFQETTMTEPNYADATPRMALPYLFAGQSQKEFIVNELLGILDALMHPVVRGMAASPPDAPDSGDMWLVADGGTGAWAGRDGQLARWQDGGWRFTAPTAGMRVFDAGTRQYATFADNNWYRAPTPPVPQGGAVVDEQARGAIAALIEVLRASALLASD